MVSLSFFLRLNTYPPISSAVECVFKNEGFPLSLYFILHPYDDEANRFGSCMARKGSVKRMSSASSPEPPMAKDEPMPDRWRRSQDHFTRFTELIKQELDDETQLVEERWKTWTKQRLILAGVALFDLSARPQGRFSVTTSSCLNVKQAGGCPTIGLHPVTSSLFLAPVRGGRKSWREWFSTVARPESESLLVNARETSRKVAGGWTGGPTAWLTTACMRH